MPRLPGPEDLGQRPTPNAPGGIAQYRGEIPGLEAAGVANMNLGRTLSAVGDDLWHEQNRLDTIKAEEAFNDLRRRQLDLTIGQKGFTNLKGGDAVQPTYFPGFMAEFGRAESEVANTLTNDRQKELFKRRAAVAAVEFKGNLLNHAVQQGDAMAKATTQATVDTEIANIAANPLDDGKVAFSNLRISEALASENKRLGIANNSPIALEQAQKVQDAAWQKRIDAVLYNDPIAAEALFRAHEKQITNPALRLQIQHQVREASLSVKAGIEAQAVIDETRAAHPPNEKRKPETMEVGLGVIQPSVQLERDRAALRLVKDELKDNPNDENLKKDIAYREAAIARAESGMQKVAYHPDDPTAQNTSGLPNSRDLAAQLPMMEGKVEARATALYGSDQGNPDRAAFARRMKQELHAKVASDVQQLNSIQRQAQGTLSDAIIGARAGGAQPTGIMAAGGQQEAKPILTAFSQVQADPQLMRAWQMVDPGVKPALLNLLAKNLDTTEGDPKLYRELFNRIHLEPGDPKKIDFYKQIVDPAVADRLSMQQIQSLRAEIDRAETPGGRSLNQMRKAADTNVSLFFRTNIMFTAQPDRQIAATMRWNEDAAKKIDEYVAAKKDVRSLFMLDTPDSIVSQKYLQTYVNSTPAQGLADQAAKTQAVAQPKSEAEYLALPPGSLYLDPTGKQRQKPGKAK